ncbi:MAG: RnfABCDGE type electron transport complex subunit B [Clostridia bacterium]
MNFLNILGAVVALGVMGAVFAAILGYASKIFAVEEDERLPLILEALPGANCGGCGYAGCANFAGAVIDGKAPTNGCPVGGADTAAKVSEIMGVEAASGPRLVARVKCSGGNNAKKKFEYEGIQDCLSATKVLGGTLQCAFGCLGFGTCEAACPFGAISVADGVAKVDAAKCTACSKCIAACPKNLIELVSEKQKVFVPCSSKDKGGVARKICEVSCIGCKLCEKECPFDAIHVENNVAVIDYTKCKNCGKCVPVCPRKLIVNERKPVVKPPVAPKPTTEEKPA